MIHLIIPAEQDFFLGIKNNIQRTPEEMKAAGVHGVASDKIKIAFQFLNLMQKIQDRNLI